MQVNRGLLNDAARQGVITEEQAERLWHFLDGHAAEAPGFRATHILYYLGGLLAIGAMTLFMTLGWERYGGWGIFAIALLYATLGIGLTELFLRRKGLTIPAGIMAAFVVVLTPLAVYGLQAGLGYWDGEYAYRDYHVYIDWRWMLMELATLGVGAVLVWRYRLPFLLMPVAVTLWYMSMDLTPFLFGDDDYSWDLRKVVSVWFGLGMVMVAVLVDLRTRQQRDFAFWLYLFGVLTFWGGLSLMDSGSELNKFLYCCINLLMIAVGAMLSRRVFAVFGGLGVAGYVGYLAWEVFEESMLFPFVLTLIGFGVVWLGVLWQRHEQAISDKLRAQLPPSIRTALESRG